MSSFLPMGGIDVGLLERLQASGQLTPEVAAQMQQAAQPPQPTSNALPLDWGQNWQPPMSSTPSGPDMGLFGGSPEAVSTETMPAASDLANFSPTRKAKGEKEASTPDFAASIRRAINGLGSGAAGDIKSLKEGLAMEQQGIHDKAAAESAQMLEQQNIYQQANNDAAKLQETMQSAEEAKTLGMKDADDKLKKMQADARLQEQYPGADMDQVNAWQAASANKGNQYSPDQVKMAKAALKKAEEIDPERAFGGAGGKIMAAIGMALGAYGAAMTHSPNFAMQIVENAIDRDVAAQKEAFNRRTNAAQRKAGDAVTDYERATKLFDKEEDRLNAAKAALWQKTDRLIAQTAPKYGAGIAEGQAQMLQGQAQQKAAEHTAQVHMSGQQIGLEKLKIEMSVAQMNGGRPLPPGSAERLGTLKSGLVKIKAMREKFGQTGAMAALTQFIPGTNASNWRERRHSIVQEMAKVFNPSGQVAEKDVKRAEKVVPNNWTTNMTADELFDQMEESIHSELGAKIGALKGAGFTGTGDDASAPDVGFQEHP